MKFYCPVCIDNVSEDKIATHFRFVHQFTTDQVVGVIFKEINELNDRVSNLCELLEIKEK